MVGPRGLGDESAELQPSSAASLLTRLLFCLLPLVLFPLNSAVRWRKVTLIGVGLLGGSLGLALRRRRLAGRVVGFVRRPASIGECEAAGAVDAVTLNLQEAVRGADLVVLCTPIAQMPALVKQMMPAMKRGAIVTDVGSVKGGVARTLTTLIAKAGGHFVGSHPMAGSEKTGVAAASESLFADAVCVLTPTPRTNRVALRKVEQLWRQVGARTLRLAPDLHDVFVSRSSHLPHLVAAALASCVLDPKHPHEQQLLCATGFRDTTRIASGSPEMWRDIALANRQNLRRALAALNRTLRQLDRALARQDAAAIQAFLEQAKRRRDGWHAHTASPSLE